MGMTRRERSGSPELRRKARAVTLDLEAPGMGVLHPTSWSQSSKKEYHQGKTVVSEKPESKAEASVNGPI